MFCFMATLKEIWILPINSKIFRHNDVKLLSLCLSNYVYDMCDMKINAFEITDGVVPVWLPVLRQLHRPVF